MSIVKRKLRGENGKQLVTKTSLTRLSTPGTDTAFAYSGSTGIKKLLFADEASSVCNELSDVCDRCTRSGHRI